MQKYGIVNSEFLNLRQGPSTNHAIVAQLTRGAVVEILGDAGFDWLNVRVTLTGQQGYVSKIYLLFSDTRPTGSTASTVAASNNTYTPSSPAPVTAQPVTASSSPATGFAPGTRAQVITSSGVNLRSGPGVNFPVIASIPNGTIVDVMDKKGDWLNIRIGSNTGYSAAQFLQIVSLPSEHSDSSGTSNSVGPVTTTSSQGNNAPSGSITGPATTTTTPTATGTGFLIEDPSLLTVNLASLRVIPPQKLSSPENVVAHTWNTYGTLVEKLSAVLSISPATAVAVLSAESGGQAFADNGKLIIRFEVHIFYNYWGRYNEALFNRFFAFDRSRSSNAWQGHAFRTSESGPMRNFHGNQDLEWQVFNFARSLDDTAAMLSTSMGAPQIMGFNFKRLGYESVQEMYEYFARSAHAQIIAMFDFVKGPSNISTAIQSLQNRDFVTFASIYNGPANAQNYGSIIQRYSDIFNKLIMTASAVTAPSNQVTPPNGVAPQEPTPSTPPPTSNVTPSTIAQPVTPPTQDNKDQQIVVISAPPPPITNRIPTVQSSVEGLRVRSGPSTASAVVEVLHANELLTVLESETDMKRKLGQPAQANLWIKVRTDETNEGYVAAWYVAPAETPNREVVNQYIDDIPDRFEIPAEYDQFWAMQDQLGLPDPFEILPVQPRSDAELVNMKVNGFGPNTFALYNWRNWYVYTNGMHNGYDYLVDTGHILRAPADGVVIRSWPFIANKLDKNLVLWCFLPPRFRDAKGRRMLSNVLVAFAHMSDNNRRKELEVVNAGDPIGISGTPGGQSDNDHLHFEVHLLTGDRNLPNINRKVLRYYNGVQNNSNSTPFNPLLFFSKRQLRYHLNQGLSKTPANLPGYPSAEMLAHYNANHLYPVDAMSLAYFRYSSASVWVNTGKKWPDGVVTMQMLPKRIHEFLPFTPVEATFLP